MEETKKCPYCGEEILAVAKKCKYCGEWLDKPVQEVKKEMRPCPICGELIETDIQICPHCNEKISNVESKLNISEEKRGETSSKGNIIDNVFKYMGNHTYALYIVLFLLFSLIFKHHLLTNIIHWFAKEEKTEISERKSIPEWSKLKKDSFVGNTWKGTCANNGVITENGVTYSINVTINSEKTYWPDSRYIEDGYSITDMVISNDNMLVEVEYKLKLHETGSFKRKDNETLTETPATFSCKMISYVIKRNESPYSTEELKPQVLSTINEKINEIESTQKTVVYRINKLTDKELVLEEMENGKSTGMIISYTTK